MMADMAVTAKVGGAAKVDTAAIEKEEEARKADLAEGTVKANTAAIVKVDEAVKVVTAAIGKVAEAAKAAMDVTAKVEEAGKVETAEAVDTEASPEGEEASTGTAQRNIPVMTRGGQGKNQEANLVQVLTAPNS